MMLSGELWTTAIIGEPRTCPEYVGSLHWVLAEPKECGIARCISGCSGVHWTYRREHIALGQHHL